MSIATALPRTPASAIDIGRSLQREGRIIAPPLNVANFSATELQLPVQTAGPRAVLRASGKGTKPSTAGAAKSVTERSVIEGDWGRTRPTVFIGCSAFQRIALTASRSSPPP